MSAECEVPAGYKRTKMGVIPNDWEITRLTDHFSIYAGGDVPKGALSLMRTPRYSVPIYANAIQSAGLYGYTNAARAKADSVTVTARGYLGHAEYRREAFLPIVRLLVLEPTGGLDARYTTYVINDRVSFAVESTGVPQLTAPQIAKYAIAAPADVAEQRAIADALGDVDALLDALDRQIAKQRDLKQAAMQQLLTGRTRLPGFTGEWQELQLGEVASFGKGFGLPKSALTAGGTEPCIHYGELFTQYGVSIRETISRTNATPTAVRSTANDVLMPTSDVTPRGLAKASCVLHDGVVLGGDILVLRPNRDRVNGTFLSCLIRYDADQVLKLVTGSTVYHLYAADMRKFWLRLPPLHEQTAIAAVLSDMDAEITALEGRRLKTHDLKQAMLQELLTGHTRLV